MALSDSGVKDFEGKVAVVTGGSRDIDRDAIDELTEKGAIAVIGDISEYRAAFIRTDVSIYSDNKALFQFAETEFGGADIAILSADIIKNFNNNKTQYPDDLKEGIFNVNSIGVIKGSKVALMHMVKRGGGPIVCITFTAGLYIDFDTSAYNASKHAIVDYVRSCSIMPTVCNVRVNAVCPSWVDEECVNVQARYFENVIRHAKKKLAEALERYTMLKNNNFLTRLYLCVNKSDQNILMTLK
ncbi:hypothetical protein EDC94DRAFT_586569 [Helicostylum pulchrum]|nr:hypothetical protein EDC94DRAFT_586569 [Helicostylum pulchrum]